MENTEIEAIAKIVVDAIFQVHKALGPGLFESTYQACLIHEISKRSLKVEHELELPITYDGIVIKLGYRIDLLVEDRIVIENKAVQTLLPVHEAQLLTYLKLSKHQLGFLVNWNVPLIKDGIKRMVNNL